MLTNMSYGPPVTPTIRRLLDELVDALGTTLSAFADEEGLELGARPSVESLSGPDAYYLAGLLHGRAGRPGAPAAATTIARRLRVELFGRARSGA